MKHHINNMLFMIKIQVFKGKEPEFISVIARNIQQLTFLKIIVKYLVIMMFKQNKIYVMITNMNL